MILVTHYVTFCPNIIADNIKNLLAWKSYIYVHTHMTQSHIQRQARPVLKTSTANHFSSGHWHQLHKLGKTRHHRHLAADLAQHSLSETTQLHSSHFHMRPCHPSLLAGDSSTTEASSAFPLICELWLVLKWQCFFVTKHLKVSWPVCCVLGHQEMRTVGLGLSMIVAACFSALWNVLPPALEGPPFSRILLPSADRKPKIHDQAQCVLLWSPLLSTQQSHSSLYLK